MNERSILQSLERAVASFLVLMNGRIFGSRCSTFCCRCTHAGDRFPVKCFCDAQRIMVAMPPAVPVAVASPSVETTVTDATCLNLANRLCGWLLTSLKLLRRSLSRLMVLRRTQALWLMRLLLCSSLADSDVLVFPERRLCPDCSRTIVTHDLRLRFHIVLLWLRRKASTPERSSWQRVGRLESRLKVCRLSSACQDFLRPWS